MGPSWSATCRRLLSAFPAWAGGRPNANLFCCAPPYMLDRDVIYDSAIHSLSKSVFPTSDVPLFFFPYSLFRVPRGVSLNPIYNFNACYSMLCPLYMAEISPPEFRGALMAMEQFSIVLGCVLGFWAGFFTRGGMSFPSPDMSRPDCTFTTTPLTSF